MLRDSAHETFTRALDVLLYLCDAGEPRSCSELEAHFKRNFDLSEVTTACEYLADQGPDRQGIGPFG